MKLDFLEQSELITYSEDHYQNNLLSEVNDISLHNKNHHTVWLNTYGLRHQESFRTVVKNNNLDLFYLRLLADKEHPNKIISFEDTFFVALNVLKLDDAEIDSELMVFICSKNFIWSIQEKKGDYFDPIRKRISDKLGIIRSQKADYLLYLLIESIIDIYSEACNTYYDKRLLSGNYARLNPSPELITQIETQRNDLLEFKRYSNSLKDTTQKLNTLTIEGINASLFAELRNQAANLTEDIDFELQQIDSAINLIFHLQGHKMNQIMKTLTIFSVVFIPLTFIAGIYGMNFKNIPELNSEYGYYIAIGAMVVIAIIIITYFRVKKWF